MFFQISPVIHKKPKAGSQNKLEDEESKIEILSLAPFTAHPKIVYDNVVIGTVQTRKILVKNPTGRDMDLFIKKSLPDELNLVLSWTEAKIEKGNELLLEMVWGPTSEEACRHNITLSDGKRINRDIAITFKSINPKKVKASGAKNKKNPIKLALTRKPISPTKKLRPQRKSPITYPSPKKKSPKKYFSPPQKYRQQHVGYRINNEVEYNISKTQQVYSYQSNEWGNEHSHLKPRLTSRANKENVSPLQQRFLCNVSGSFTSPTNSTFTIKKNDESRDTYILDPMSERRDTYILQTHKLEKIVETNTTFELHNKFIEAADSFFIESKENSPRFRDSLESPVPNLPLREKNDQNPSTPSLESILNNTCKNRRSPRNFEYMLRVQNFSLSPAMSPFENGSPNIFVPSISSTSSKPPSTNNSYENVAKSSIDLFAQSSFQLNKSNETYTKTNTSSDTYVKGNSSFETYVKGNLSGGTYVKDNSTDDIGYLDASPVSSKTYGVVSPVFLKPKPFELSPVVEHNRNAIESRLGQNLSAIAEESGIFNESQFRVGSKRKSTSFGSQPTKRERMSIDHKKDWSKSGGTAVRIAKTTSGLNLKQFTNNSTSQDRTQPLSSITETASKTVIVKNPFLYANIIDPFMTSQIYCNVDWIDQQEKNFKKWLNALLTPPDELSTKSEVDVAKVWQECTKKEVSEAPTKETMSLKYHTNRKLDYLRKQAQNMFRSKEMSTVLQKVCQAVESGKLSIREDKDLHLNLKLKSDITRLILGYNPLWLRIGLETIYNEIIPLKSNSDSHGLATFILERLLKDPHLMKKHKTIYAPKYSSDLKKFILKKFLILVYFLDRAKNEKLIQHDPCLFCKNAIEKESKLLLTHFARETLSAVGDITKYLKCLGYVVTHAQAYIHEFDYAVKNLGVDLRDGVRLTRVMEIIQMRSDLTAKLRVPAISRLQKVHNMQLVFKSLEENGYEIQYDINAKDIVDGHKEKTLSFLWQIIYKFEAPLMVTNATTIQTWFRSLPVMLKRRKLQRIREERENAAKKIQLWYRRQRKAQVYYALSEFVHKHVEEKRRLLATVKIQRFYRMRICRRRFLTQYNSLIKLQAFAKGWLIRNNYKQRIDAAVIIQKIFRGYACRNRFLQLKRAVIVIQRKYRALKEMKQAKLAYECLMRVTVTIQRRFKAKLQMRLCRKEYTISRDAAIKIQSFYRMCIARKRFSLLKTAAKTIQARYIAQRKMRSARTTYQSLTKATIFVQRRFRANLKMKKYRDAFNSLRSAVIQIQSYYRMHYLRKRFLHLRSAVLVVQARYRAQIAMKMQRNKYLSLRKATICVQNRFRAKLAMKMAKRSFIQLRQATIKIQSHYRMYVLRKRYLELREAAKVVQQRYRAQKAMRTHASYYSVLRESVLIIQRRFRANQKKKEARHQYLYIRRTTITIQTHFRMFIVRRYFLELKRVTIFVQRKYLAQKAMKKQKEQYQHLKNAALILQRRWRAREMCVKEKTCYTTLKRVTINIQQRFRANQLMLHDRRTYLENRSATVKIQMWYRSVLAMKACRERYILFKKSVIIIEQRYLELKLARDARTQYQQLQKATKTIQVYYKALLQMRSCRQSFGELRSTTIALQRRFRANKVMQKHQVSYQKLKTTTILVQRVIRANKVAKIQRNRFLLEKTAAIKIQRWYRATMEMRKCRNYYASLKLAVAATEARYKAKIQMQRERKVYECLRTATVTIQTHYRSILETRRVRRTYLELKYAATIVQRRYRANISAKMEHQRYERLKTATVLIQRKYKAKKAMEKCKAEFDALKKATIFIQQKFRAQRQMEECRGKYQYLQSAILLIQRKYRAQKLMVIHSQQYRVLKQVVIRVQQRFRANLLARNERSQYTQLRNSVLIIQRRFRAQILMKTQRQQFIKLREATVVIQRRYKAIVLMRERRNYFVVLKKAAILIQRRYRSIRAMKNQRLYFEILKKTTIVVQRRYRANKLANECRSEYLKLRYAAMVIQRRFRARCLTISCVTQYTRIRWAALVIQRRYRAEVTMRVEMMKYTKLRHATFVIQRKLRATILTKEQRHWFLKFKQSVTVIQAFYRSYLKMKRQREVYLTTRSNVINLQRFARGYLVRKTYEPLLTPEAIEARRVLKKQNEAAVKIQASWRGYSLRKSNIPVMVALRKRREHRVAEPRLSCQARTLAQRCEAAMLCMTAENSSLLMVISALEDLDFITRHCRDLCHRLSLILPYQLYIIITSAARSLPEMNALNMATLILINFCKYPHTRKNSWDAEYMDGVISVLLHWCDKEAPLFSTLCTLLWLFGHEEAWKKVILALPNIQQRFTKIYSLVHRKQNMVLKSKKVNNNSVFGPIGNLKVPTRTANWGLDYDRPNTFTNAVFALTNLLKILDLS